MRKRMRFKGLVFGEGKVPSRPPQPKPSKDPLKGALNDPGNHPANQKPSPTRCADELLDVASVAHLKRGDVVIVQPRDGGRFDPTLAQQLREQLGPLVERTDVTFIVADPRLDFSAYRLIDARDTG